ncbi:MAG: diguanylate cyclase, partial [Clostridiales bacterium]|nr:diguanylate cyclase [Clostridiales bacterium]
CYRIGGDEFVFLGTGESDVKERIAYFDSLVKADQERLEFPFNVALGYTLFDETQDKDLQDTIKRSDAMMYHDKQEKKDR